MRVRRGERGIKRKMMEDTRKQREKRMKTRMGREEGRGRRTGVVGRRERRKRI